MPTSLARCTERAVARFMKLKQAIATIPQATAASANTVAMLPGSLISFWRVDSR
jgi:hypothetical protein